MPDKKEMIFIIIAALVIGYVSSFKEITWIYWLSMSGLALIMLFVHHIGQKITAFFYDCSVEIRPWTIKQFGFARNWHFKFDFPMWFVLPISFILLTFGSIKWLALTTFESAPLPGRARRKYAELTDWHIALMAAGGFFFNALLAVVCHICGWNDFAMLNIYFMLFNIIPISNLDGSKMFFGSPMLWTFSFAFILILLLLLGTASLLTTIFAAVAIAIAALVLFYLNFPPAYPRKTY